MDLQNEKCVIIIDEALPIGILANTAAILGMTLGKKFPQLVGADVTDQDGHSHLGIIEIPLPILKTNAENVKKIRTKLYDEDYKNLLVVDFSDLAQSCKTYDGYIDKMAATQQSELSYWGIAIFGDKKKVNKLTGSIPLLR